MLLKVKSRRGAVLLAVLNVGGVRRVGQGHVHMNRQRQGPLGFVL